MKVFGEGKLERLIFQEVGRITDFYDAGDSQFDLLESVDTISKSQAKTVPFRYICSIEKKPTGGGLSPVVEGTGTLIGPRAVLTAAHVLVSDFKKLKLLDAKKIRVRPGRAGGLGPFGSSLAKALKAPRLFFDTRLGGTGSVFDFAIIILEKSFAKAVGFWGQSPRPTDDARGSRIGALSGWRPGRYKVNHSGYPRFNAGVQSHWFSDTLPALSKDFLFIDSQIQRGESGSPVWVTRHRSLGGRHLWGIVQTGSGQANANLPSVEAEALLIRESSPVMSFIKKHRFAKK